MSYRLEGKDIVLSGMENGISDSPYNGIADMRNINILTIPGEGSVQYKEVPATLPPVLNNIPFTASGSTDRLTWAGPNTLYEGAAIHLSFSNTINYLVVAGGGGGGGGSNTGGDAGSPGGGGGGGGVKTGSLSDLAADDYAITVGAGGTKGGGGATGSDGSVGGDSSIAALVVSAGGGGGGGGGQGSGSAGNNGGSGGGAGFGNDASTHPGGTATPAGQGNNGGSSGAGGADINSGGGGGAGTAGSNGTGTTSGAGGNGLASSISGSSVTYGGGGGGGAIDTSGVTGTPGAGGTGGGGAGAPPTPVAGTANRGGGGGGGRGDDDGSNTDGANGGSGIVILSYPTGSVTATGGTITTSGGNTIHTFTTSGTFTITTSGLSSDTVYYVRNIVGNTFQISLSVLGPIVDLDGDSVGEFTTYQYGDQRGVGTSDLVPPISYVVDRAAQNDAMNGVYLTDLSNYIWGIFPAEIDFGGDPVPANTLIFMGNIGGVATHGNSFNGVTIWKGYLFIFGMGSATVDVASLNEIFFGDGPTASWIYDWWNASGANSVYHHKIPILVGQDDTIYYTSTSGVGSILEVAGEIFDPSDSGTYTRNTSALAIPQYDESTCLAELGTNLLVGGSNSFVYPWDRVSTSFTYPIVIPENGIVNIVGTNQNAYIFSGNRGRIFITNGSAVDEYKKFPDYVTGTFNPYYAWRDASFARNQLYFSFTPSTNADVEVATTNGAWAIDLKKDALYMVNKISNAGYSGKTSMTVEMPPASISDQPSGTSMLLGWRVSNTFGIDVGSSTPYTSLESFIEFDMIPIGTIFNSYTPSQIEWKVSQPLGGNGTPETIRLLAREDISSAFVEIGSTTLSGATTDTWALSDLYQANFQKAQWLQIRLESSSNATTPTFNRFYEIRIRDFKP